jgi:CRP/FNR family cyclic AMP-dependent transcriptional regulator
MTEREYNAGDIILKEGDPSDFAYMVLSGEVEIFTEFGGDTVILGIMKAGEFLGEMGIVDGQPRSASARAKDCVSLKIFEKKEFFRLISQDSSSAYRLISRLCKQMRTITRRLAVAEATKQISDSIENEAPFNLPLDFPAEPEPEKGPINCRYTLLPSSPRLMSVIPAGGMEIMRWPFLIGRLPEGAEAAPARTIDLIIPDKRPFRLSRQHFALYQDREGCGILDLGSTSGTQVNGQYLGLHFSKDFEYLKPGENQIVAGGLDSTFVFTVLVEPA